jgi:CheY-like chemotaxis protein
LLDILTLCDYEGSVKLTLIFIVTVTENGKAAYEELKDENKDFDLVLLDLYMPELDGFELLSLM